MERMTNEDALQELSREYRGAATEMPTFTQFPRAVGMRKVDDAMYVTFACADVANSVIYAIEVPFGPMPEHDSEGPAQVARCAANALVIADRIAKAVFN